MVKHTQHVCDTYLTVRLAQLCVLSVTTVRFYVGGRYKYLIDVDLNLTIFFDLCSDPSCVSMRKKNHVNLMIFDVFTDTRSQLKNERIFRAKF